MRTGEIGKLVANDYAQGQAFERQIGMMASDDLTTDITINAPRRVIAPFVFSVSKAATTKEISVCTFQEEAAWTNFNPLLANLNFEIKRDCQMGSGRPTAAWKETVFATLGAVDQFQEATATVLGTEVKLLVSKDTDELFTCKIRAGT